MCGSSEFHSQGLGVLKTVYCIINADRFSFWINKKVDLVVLRAQKVSKNPRAVVPNLFSFVTPITKQAMCLYPLIKKKYIHDLFKNFYTSIYLLFK